MFKVIFKAQKFFGKIEVNDIIKQYYEKFIEFFIKNETYYLNIEKLRAVIIPNDFLHDVLEFQRQNDIDNPNITNTEFARAFGKVVYIKKEDAYYVFIDVDKAMFIVEDNMFKLLFSNLNSLNYEKCLKERKQALNLLVHELSHVEMESIIKSNSILDNDFKENISIMLGDIFNEYYACRRAKPIYGEYCMIQHDEGYLNNIENKIMIQRKKYNNRLISLNDFCYLFFEYTRLYIIHVASEIGSIYGDKENVVYDNLRIGKYIEDLKSEFDKMYDIVFKEKKLLISDKLINTVIDIWKEFRIYIIETERGIRVDIPA